LYIQKICYPTQFTINNQTLHLLSTGKQYQHKGLKRETLIFKRLGLPAFSSLSVEFRTKQYHPQSQCLCSRNPLTRTGIWLMQKLKIRFPTARFLSWARARHWKSTADWKKSAVMTSNLFAVCLSRRGSNSRASQRRLWIHDRGERVLCILCRHPHYGLCSDRCSVTSTRCDGRVTCSDGNGKVAGGGSSGPGAGEEGNHSQRSRALLTEQQVVDIYSRHLNAASDGAQSSRVLAWQYGVSCPSADPAGP
jgi:hypothetical protein